MTLKYDGVLLVTVTWTPAARVDPFINVPHSVFIPSLLQGDLSDIVTDSIQYSARGTCENIRDERHYAPIKKKKKKKKRIQFPPYPDCNGSLL